MPTHKKYFLLEKTVSRVKKRGVLLLEDVLDLLDVYGDVVLQAVEALEYGRAYQLNFGRKYKVDLFVGNHDYYIIIPEKYYCGCMSKYVAASSKRSICYHLIAYKLLDALKKIKILFFDEEDFFRVIDELKYKRVI